MARARRRAHAIRAAAGAPLFPSHASHVRETRDGGPETGCGEKSTSTPSAPSRPFAPRAQAVTPPAPHAAPRWSRRHSFNRRRDEARPRVRPHVVLPETMIGFTRTRAETTARPRSLTPTAEYEGITVESRIRGARSSSSLTEIGGQRVRGLGASPIGHGDGLERHVPGRGLWQADGGRARGGGVGQGREPFGQREHDADAAAVRAIRIRDGPATDLVAFPLASCARSRSWRSRCSRSRADTSSAWRSAYFSATSGKSDTLRLTSTTPSRWPCCCSASGRARPAAVWKFWKTTGFGPMSACTIWMLAGSKAVLSPT